MGLGKSTLPRSSYDAVFCVRGFSGCAGFWGKVFRFDDDVLYLHHAKGFAVRPLMLDQLQPEAALPTSA
jgi:hypothetical protein